jgi:hypothetical protein
MPKGSDGRYIHVGLVGPKPRPKGVGDGQTVDIPLPLADDQVLRWGRGEVGVPSRWSGGGQACGLFGAEAWGRLRDTKANHVDPHFPEKPPAGSRQRPYRRPTQVGGCESTKVDG